MLSRKPLKHGSRSNPPYIVISLGDSFFNVEASRKRRRLVTRQLTAKNNPDSKLCIMVLPNKRIENERLEDIPTNFVIG